MNTVIIAVHDPNILYLLQRYAEESGFQTVSACEGKELLALLAEQADPTLIILDAELRDIAGHQVWRRLRLEASLRNIPVVVYSHQDELAEEWHDDQAGYLPKSVMYDDFVAALNRAGVSLGPAFH